MQTQYTNQNNSAYLAFYENFDWDKTDFKDIEVNYSSDVSKSVDEIRRTVISKSQYTTYYVGKNLLELCQWMESNDKNSSIFNLIQKASLFEKFLMVKLIDKVSQKTEPTTDKDRIIKIRAFSLYFGMKEIHNLAEQKILNDPTTNFNNRKKE